MHPSEANWHALETGGRGGEARESDALATDVFNQWLRYQERSATPIAGSSVSASTGLGFRPTVSSSAPSFGQDVFQHPKPDLSPLTTDLPTFQPLPEPREDKVVRRSAKLRDIERKRVCEYHIAHPRAKQEEMAAVFGVERSTISKILKRRDRWLAVPEPNDVEREVLAASSAQRRVSSSIMSASSSARSSASSSASSWSHHPEPWPTVPAFSPAKRPREDDGVETLATTGPPQLRRASTSSSYPPLRHAGRDIGHRPATSYDAAMHQQPQPPAHIFDYGTADLRRSSHESLWSSADLAPPPQEQPYVLPPYATGMAAPYLRGSAASSYGSLHPGSARSSWGGGGDSSPMTDITTPSSLRSSVTSPGMAHKLWSSISTGGADADETITMSYSQMPTVPEGTSPPRRQESAPPPHHLRSASLPSSAISQYPHAYPHVAVASPYAAPPYSAVPAGEQQLPPPPRRASEDGGLSSLIGHVQLHSRPGSSSGRSYEHY